ncbi:MAG TPA: glutamate-1-semialdehyde-2,1-aminomutase [Candidatus Hydrogenedentes bacterium]|nr:glutamate-1-semialdehyde-2,1-aminomutase [Candidatus Hydrogenedentota bacterium]
MKQDNSNQLWTEAQQVLPGGVNSPVRAFKGVGGAPFFARGGSGACITDADGNTLIDYVLSWGPLAAGHAHPQVVAAVKKAVENGFGFGIPTEQETLLARKVMKHYPSIEMIRFVNSGTEATMSAMRLARGYTKRDLVLKIEGCYHGHVDSLLASAGSGVATLALPDCPGIPAAIANTTLVVPYNDLDAVNEVFARYGGDIACVIIEPVAGNMGVVPPEPGYLEGLRAITTEHGALFVFDEVMSGFRVALGGAQQHYGVTPDITALGKVIGGGMPVGAYGGRRDIMEHLAPVGPVYQAGTLSGNPVAMTAGLATIEVIEQPGVFDGMVANMTRLNRELGAIMDEAGIPAYQTQAGAMACLFFTDAPVRNFADAKRSDTQRYARWFHAMLDNGVYLAPSQFEAAFISCAHTGAVIDRTLEAARAAVRGL